MRMSWLYFAMRSLRDRRPVLIFLQFVAIARSAIVEILSLTGAVAHDRVEPGPMRDLGRFERLGERANLVHLQQNDISDSLLKAALRPLGSGHEQIVTVGQLDGFMRPVESPGNRSAAQLRHCPAPHPPRSWECNGCRRSRGDNVLRWRARWFLVLVRGLLPNRRERSAGCLWCRSCLRAPRR